MTIEDIDKAYAATRKCLSLAKQLCSCVTETQSYPSACVEYMTDLAQAAFAVTVDLSAALDDAEAAVKPLHVDLMGVYPDPAHTSYGPYAHFHEAAGNVAGHILDDVWFAVDPVGFKGAHLNKPAFVANWQNGCRRLAGKRWRAEVDESLFVMLQKEAGALYRERAMGGDSSPSSSIEGGATPYPWPDEYERDAAIFQQRKSGKTWAETLAWLHETLSSNQQNKKNWTPVESTSQLRRIVKRYGEHFNLPIPNVQGGRPKSSG